MIIVCVRFKDSAQCSRFVCHEDLRVSNVKHHLIEEMNFPKSAEITLLDHRSRLVDDKVPIEMLEKVAPWANLVQLFAELKKDRNETKRQDLQNRTKLVWTVKPTTDDAAFGRWIARPDLTFSKQLKYSVLIGVFQGNCGEFNWHLVELTDDERMAKIRGVIAKQYEQPEEDFWYAYESGFFYRSSEGARRHATNFANVVENRVQEVYRDDEDNSVISSDRSETTTYRLIHDSSRLSIPAQGAPKIWIFTKTEYYTSAPDSPTGVVRLPEQNAIEDFNIVAFNDGLLLKDKTDDSVKPKFFASLNSGDAFADVDTGKLYETREEAYESDDYGIPKENRQWALQVFVMHDGMKLPKWKVPDGKYLQLLVRVDDKIELKDDALCRITLPEPYVIGQSRLDRWCDFYKENPTEQHMYMTVTDYFRSVETQRL